MAVVTTEQVRDYLSHPTWSDAQIRACEQEIDAKTTALEGWFRVPIEPVERTEYAPIYRTGLVATTAPIYTLLALDDVPVVDGMPPAPYELRDGVWLYNRDYDGAVNRYTSRPFDITVGGEGYLKVAVRHLAGWGGAPDIVNAIIRKVGAVMLNRHDDTVVARNLDTESPKPLDEDWSDKELMMLRRRRRPVGARP